MMFDADHRNVFNFILRVLSRSFFIAVIASVAILYSSTAFSSTEFVVYAKGDTAKIFDGPSKSSAVVGELKRGGDGVGSEVRVGLFWRVKMADGRVGFVYVMDATHRQASPELSRAIANTLSESRDMKSDDPDMTRARTSVMGVRGLAEDDDMFNAAFVRPNIKAVFDMEFKTVHRTKIDGLGLKIISEIEQRSRVKK